MFEVIRVPGLESGFWTLGCEHGVWGLSVISGLGRGLGL